MSGRKDKVGRTELISASEQDARTLPDEQRAGLPSPRPATAPTAPTAPAPAPDAVGPQQRRFLRRVTTLAAIGGALFGYDTGVISGALPYMRQDLVLTSLDEGLITSTLLVGAAVGAVAGGRVADRVGRRRSMGWAGIVFTAGALAVALAPDVPFMVAARFVLGLAVGSASVAVPMYLAELAPAADRGRLVSLNSLMIVSGQLLAYVVNAALAPTGDWRLMLGLAAAPAVALVVGCAFVPETPRWLQANGFRREAIEVLRKSRSERETEREFHRQQRAERLSRRRRESAGWAEFRTPWLRRVLFIGIGIGFVQQATGTNAIIYFAPTILETTGLSTSVAVVSTIAVGVISVAATAVGLTLVDRHGRRTLMVVGQVGGAACLLALSFVIGRTGESAAMSFVTLGLMAAFLAFQQSTVAPVAWLLIAEIFPTRVKGLAGGATTMALWLSNFAISLVFLPVLEAIGGRATFLCFVALSVLCLLFTLKWVPETRGRTLEQVEEELRAAGTRTAA
ncbi:sugar porter family MFS transporter [Kineococcus sp. SYSU DK001]|uniref:sugar porter family MFS transporter n=1 Tax=Kineococcus sp. SYSU DK001 TaxID=3383122 RepID=UPI003D7D8B54